MHEKIFHMDDGFSGLPRVISDTHLNYCCSYLSLYSLGMRLCAQGEIWEDEYDLRIVYSYYYF